MKIRSYIPFLTIPLGCFILFQAGADVIAGKVALDLNTLFMVLWSALAVFWVSSGIVKLRHPYIVTDDRSIKVFGHPFSNRVSQEMFWDDIAVSRGRTFTSVVLELKDTRLVKVAINGIGPSKLREFLSLIESRIRNANQRLDATGNNAAGSLRSVDS